MSKRFVLLNPGPVNVTERVRRALLKDDICHREREFTVILNRTRKKILKAFALNEREYTTVIFTASGTASLEAAVCASVSQRGKMLIVNNGVYGERIAQIARLHKIDSVVLNFGFGSPVIISKIEEALKRDNTIEVVSMVHHETSSGMINPVYEVGNIAKKHNRLFLIDSISALAGENLSFSSSNVGVCVGSVAKCIESIAGLSFVIIKWSILKKIDRYPNRLFYLDLIGNLKAQEKGSVPFTPSVQLFYALDFALDELIKEGVANRIKRYKVLSNILRRGFKRLGLKFYISDKYLSNTLTALYIPRGLSYNHLHNRLKERGFIIYAGQARLKNKIFRVANMGRLTKNDIIKFLSVLEEALKKH